MRKVLEVLYVEKREGVSKASGKPYSLHLAQCVIRGEDGSAIVGELSLADDKKETKPGFYEAVFELAADFDKRITAKLVSLVPVQARMQPKAA